MTLKKQSLAAPLLRKRILLAILTLLIAASQSLASPAKNTTALNINSQPHFWRVTAYCACKRCCGPRARGITASGKPVRYGYIAVNWLPFGTKIRIGSLGVFTVMDRGAKSLFGTPENQIRHIDVYLPSHKQAKKFGVRYFVEIHRKK